MKRRLFIIICLLQCLIVKSQSLYQCQYWFDQEPPQTVTVNFNSNTAQMELDGASLSDGIHVLFIQVKDTTGMWCAARNYLFYKIPEQINPVNPENVTYHCWFDEDFEHEQTGPFGTGQFLLDAEGLESGIHLLYVALECDGLSSTRSYMFYKMPEQINSVDPENVTYHCWFDEDFEHKQTGPFGTGQFLLDAEGLESGIHLLYVALEGEGLTSTRSYMFYKMPEQINPANPENVTYHCWFDEDFEHEQSGPFGTGMIQLNTLLLGEGEHTVYILLESEALTTTQSYTFEKHMTDGHIIITIANPTGAGTLSGQGWYELGDTCMLAATANQGYVFENWSNEGNIVSDSTTYSFTVTDDSTFVANFVEIIVLDTTIYAEICYGEDYLENGFEIIQPEMGLGNYSMVFHPAFNYDSIVNLALTVHSTYYFEEDTTLCEMTPFYWHGYTYTESGIYYDSLQTVHGCDSIYALSLEFFNTPLGEFAGMTPTNNYPFTSLPITFSWDAVSGAEYYNLYLWNANDPTPSVPFAGNIYNRSCYVSSLQNHQTYNWYVEAVNTCFSSTSSVRSFSLNISPSMNVSTNSLAFGEVVLNDSVSMNMFVSGNALDDAITLQITGEDASMFSFEQGSNWNGLTGGSLMVTFSPTAVQYNYTANLVITTGTLTQTVQLTGSLADMFVFNTYVTQDIFEMNSTIPIYGTVTDVNNNPMAGAEVEVKVMVMGTTRSLFATTGNDGHFSVDFVPAYSESGYYTINSGRVGHNSTAVHDDFNIPGMNLVTNGWILWDVVQNETTTGSVVIRNRSQIPLTNIQVTATNLPEGCSFTFQPLSLQGMEEGVLEYSVTGSALTSGNNYEEVRLVASSAEGASMNFSAWYYCAEPRGILYAAPNNITTTMTKGNSKIVDVMLYNNGTGPTGSVYLDLPFVDWLSVVGNDTLPSIAVHDSAYFSLRLSANENTSLVQYSGNIAINCERGDGLSLPYTITAVSDSTGMLLVDVTDDYTYNGNGEHLSGATVTVKGYYSLQTVAIGLTDSDGTFTVEDIPEGYYRMSITAPHHAEYQATIQIEGGQTNTQNIYLQYQAISYSWNVVPTEIEDEYTFELVVDYETNVPVPVVVIDMPQTFPELEEGESYVFDYIITNYGLVDTYDATLYPPTGHPLYDFTPLITEIDTLHAQSSVVIPCSMTRRTRQRSQAVSEALGRGGSREETECPYSALTQTKQCYTCGDKQNWFWANVWRIIGGYACEAVPYTPTPGAPAASGGGGSGGGGTASSSSSSPQIIIVHNDDCNFDPCLTDTKDAIDNCDSNGNGNGTTPNLPLKNPTNNR
ncbi:MAG: carboxypeptidase regulatory-like domain-containing protein [Bacteroidales bacterium]|nr:carboxypeptidase regulatory-like domain-containing protein [Bacteroidales bacterium]